MHDDLDQTLHAASDTGCPDCGSVRVWYRVQHTGVSHRPLQERSLLWECRQCAARWSEPLVALPLALPTAASQAPRPVA